MYWAFDSKGRATLTPSTDIPSLLLTNGRSEDVNPIQQFDCTMAHQYLGLWNSPSLSMKPNFVALHKKAKSYAHRLFKSGLNTYGKHGAVCWPALSSKRSQNALRRKQKIYPFYGLSALGFRIPSGSFPSGHTATPRLQARSITVSNIILRSTFADGAAAVTCNMQTNFFYSRC
jgi:hypothetical protein